MKINMINNEEKYKLALEKAKEMYNQKDATNGGKLILESIFPELKESEDERIRKEIINWFHSYNGCTKQVHPELIDSWLAWLEKQRNNKQDVNYPKFNFDDVLALQCCVETIKKSQEDKELYEQLQNLHDRVHDAYWLEKQGEQNPVDKVEPKFNVGDWVIYECGKDSAALQIKNTVYGTYEFTDNSTLNVVDENTLRLWTIQDAKDGDVLVYSVDKLPFIFKGLVGFNGDYPEYPAAYCGIDTTGEFTVSKTNIRWTDNYKDIYPATKEQRDLLFQKMKESGYEWDAERKELKKIEQKYKEKPKNYVSMDDFIADALIEEIENSELNDKSKHNCIFWIKSHKQKPAWSEYDEEMFNAIIADIQFTQKAHTHDANQVVYEREIDWIKSLKERLGGK